MSKAHKVVSEDPAWSRQISSIRASVEQPLVAEGLRQALDRRLDQGLEETFPASDPVSVVCDEPTAKATNAMESVMQDLEKPNIVVSHSDLGRLTTLATGLLGRYPEVAKELLSEMDRAEVRPAEAISANIVQMGSCVVFRADDGQTRKVKLVFPGDADIADGRVSILTPIGAALIGLSEGQSMAWKTRDGRSRRLTVVAVERTPSGQQSETRP
jgi:regulator of nucleoside diphosphate kinase